MVVNWVQAAEPDLAYFLYENDFLFGIGPGQT